VANPTHLMYLTAPTRDGEDTQAADEIAMTINRIAVLPLTGVLGLNACGAVSSTTVSPEATTVAPTAAIAAVAPVSPTTITPVTTVPLR
jgi:hypothetical protein